MYYIVVAIERRLRGLDGSVGYFGSISGPPYVDVGVRVSGLKVPCLHQKALSD